MKELVTNTDADDTTNHHGTGAARRGRVCRIPLINDTAAAGVHTLRENSLTTHEPSLCNCLIKVIQKKLSDRTRNSFKKLDHFLRTMSNLPTLPHYHELPAGIGLTDQLQHTREAGCWSSGVVWPSVARSVIVASVPDPIKRRSEANVFLPNCSYLSVFSQDWVELVFSRLSISVHHTFL